ncbi:MAG: M1 family metallopeptidase [Planctomycetota bacterium]
MKLLRSGPVRAALALLGGVLAATSHAQESITDQRSSEAHYVIQARVDEAKPNAALDDGPQKDLTGSLTLTWENRSGEPVADLWFHLYLNAFANNQSLHLTQGKGSTRSGKIERGFGWQDVRSIRVGDVDLTETMQWRMPQAGAPLDRTVFSVALPEPVPDGASVTVAIDWESRLPRVRRRWGTKGDFIFLAHWFPKVGVYEGGRGWRTHSFNLNTEFYSSFGTYDVTLDLPEVYTGKVAASGVQIGEPIVDGGRVKTRFLAPSQSDRERVDPVAGRGSLRSPLVHDFAWTADPDYVVYQDTFRWDDWAKEHEFEVSEAMRSLGRTRDELRARPVEVVVMLHPERADQDVRHWRATCAALFFYGLWYGEYPYERITAVDPAWGAGAASGMEYPTLFTCGTELFTASDMHRPESVTVHEAGHQFWYGVVANNEPEAAWLDEGLNSYTDSEVLYRAYGESRTFRRYSRLPVYGRPPLPEARGKGLADALTLRSLEVRNPVRYGFERFGDGLPKLPSWLDWVGRKSWAFESLQPSPFIDWWRDQPAVTFIEESNDPRWGDRNGYLRDPNTDPIETAVWDYADSTSYSTNSYARTAVALRSLNALVGREAFLRGMRHYAELWRYRHPYPADFFDAFQVGADVDVQWYFDELFRGTGTVDWSVEVKQSQALEPKGWFRCADGRWQEDCAPSIADLYAVAEPAESGPAAEGGPAAGEADAAKAPQLYDVLVRRDGELRLPVTIRVVFDDKSQQDFVWTREEQALRTWWRLPISPGAPKISAVVIDPDRGWYLDTDMRNNQWFAKPDRLAPLRYGERALAGATHTLQWFMSIGG